MLTAILSLLALATAVFAIRAEYIPNQTLIYIFKPATTLLIIGIAWLGMGETAVLSGIETGAAYKTLIIIGLIFCLGGDIFLMLPQRYFIVGLISFLIGHVFYIIAFVNEAGFNFNVGWLLPLLAFGLFMYARLHPHLGELRIPVIIYLLVILTMAWQASGRWTAQATTSALLALLGAFLFVASDSVLALDRFRQSFPSARVIVLSTYWAAQWLIAFSTHY